MLAFLRNCLKARGSRPAESVVWMVSGSMAQLLQVHCLNSQFTRLLLQGLHCSHQVTADAAHGCVFWICSMPCSPEASHSSCWRYLKREAVAVQ